MMSLIEVVGEFSSLELNELRRRVDTTSYNLDWYLKSKLV